MPIGSVQAALGIGAKLIDYVSERVILASYGLYLLGKRKQPENNHNEPRRRIQFITY